ncbi:glycosyltransferase family 2 protein [Sphingobacterium hungaricum]|uniref:Glycosyltransferase 2-like domain-containing protein n=1 Tax=Sphingobacterium hungaricum TaxID=2082723 RepID=A0A928UZA8_9SPHI|nr:glycosyltransferase family 2 protein [Sphingobacterium hungaricum]MBE8714126.1 hypothetical protein [Sphingobacterium hungaricum]
MASKVSIISIYYNRENSVEQSIESLRTQSYSDVEIILVDDNSSDNTYSKLIYQQTLDSRIRVIRNETNKGFTQSLIDVIKNVDSKYIAIHGSGDISLPKRIETQVAFLENNGDVGVVGVGVTNRKVNNVSDTIMEISTEHLLSRNMLNHGAVMFRVDDYHKSGGYRSFFKYRQDKDLWYRMSLISRIFFLPDKLYEWSIQESSVSKTTALNFEPVLLSEFATFLIRERIKYGYDSLDKFGERGALLFNPSTSIHIFIRNLKSYLLRKEWSSAQSTVELMIIINRNIFYNWGLVILLKYIKKKK